MTYGDLTGDGQPEAFLPVWCSVAGLHLMDDGPSNGTRPLNGARLLVVQMQADHTLRGLAYVGPAGAAFHRYEAIDGNLFTQVQYETETSWTADAPAHTRPYRWDGTAFQQISGRTAPLVLVPAKTGEGSNVELSEIRDGSAVVCPQRTIRFSGESTSFVYTSWIDLDGDGDQEGIVQISCNGSDSLFLLGQGESAFVTLGIPYASNGSEQIEPDGWELNGTNLTVTVRHKTTGIVRTITLKWDGVKFS